MSKKRFQANSSRGMSTLFCLIENVLEREDLFNICGTEITQTGNNYISNYPKKSKNIKTMLSQVILVFIYLMLVMSKQFTNLSGGKTHKSYAFVALKC